MKIFNNLTLKEKKDENAHRFALSGGRDRERKRNKIIIPLRDVKQAN